MAKNIIGKLLLDNNYLVWIIPSFDLLSPEKDCRIYSPTSYDNVCVIRKYFVISPNWPYRRYIRKNWRREIPDEWIGLIIASRDNKVPAIKNIQIGFVREENNKPKYYIGEWIEESEDYKYFIVPTFMDKFILHTEYGDDFNPYDFNEKLKGHLFCEVISKQVGNVVSTQTEDKEDLERLSQDLKELFVGGKDSDLIIMVKDREFNVHRAILRSRCPVFDKMFSHELSESYTDTVPIEDCDPHAFEEFLFFIYAGRVQHISPDNVCNLYYIADKYDVPGLKEKCISFLKNSLTIEIICDVICLSTNHGETELLEHAVNFFAKNIEAILITDKWRYFLKENPTEANELYIKALKLGFKKLDV